MSAGNKIVEVEILFNWALSLDESDEAKWADTAEKLDEVVIAWESHEMQLRRDEAEWADTAEKRDEVVIAWESHQMQLRS